MKTIRNIMGLLAAGALLIACNSTPSLQQYYVDNAGDPNFISVDIPASILNVSEIDLTPEQKSAYHSLRKFNVLAFKLTEENKNEFEGEKEAVNAILKNDAYEELMRINTGSAKGVVKILGDEDSIDEVILFGNDDSQGFALIRVLGDDMRPENVMQLVEVIQKGNLDDSALGPLKGFLDQK
ncbi:DUF4252 domain-containing protein [Robertkochia marina]|uniref:DUF4252 domain-containing protein n=1 Tax=Robertkochia marina TaxID=1227945 RepID=A0A4V3UY25_9FLAO|nr:DUF4252 domain-containing protein [Robertkochia marina]THD67476.1 DUF4252 domain-containing protein [Robertkochia marina]TRZ44656.1 DUF4252 domain-containing protein [Robertkochia marina]